MTKSINLESSKSYSEKTEFEKLSITRCDSYHCNLSRELLFLSKNLVIFLKELHVSQCPHWYFECFEFKFQSPDLCGRARALWEIQFMLKTVSSLKIKFNTRVKTVHAESVHALEIKNYDRNIIFGKNFLHCYVLVAQFIANTTAETVYLHSHLFSLQTTDGKLSGSQILTTAEEILRQFSKKKHRFLGTEPK